SRLGGGSTRVRSCANQEAWPAWLVSRPLSYLFEGSTRLAPAGYKHGAPNSSDAGVALRSTHTPLRALGIKNCLLSCRTLRQQDDSNVRPLVALTAQGAILPKPKYGSLMTLLECNH